MKKHDSTEHLLEAFDMAVAVELVPFMDKKGMGHLVGQSDYEWPISGLLKKKYSTMSGIFFWWVNRFQNADRIIDICYGDREFLLETRVYCVAANEWFGAWELLYAAGAVDIHATSGKQFVTNCDFMQRTIKEMSDGIIKNWEILSGCSKKLIDEALLLREERMRRSQEEANRETMERACIQASRAFHAKQYQEAIDLLSPFEHIPYFPKASEKLLAIARKHS